MPRPSPAEALTLPGGLTVRELLGLDELRQATALYAKVFDYTPEDGGLNPRMLESLRANSGSVCGVVNEHGTVLAFAYGWTAVAADRGLYHWSQAAVVDAALQGQGVGRALKQVQAAMASRAGADRMRWTFDPLLTRNAHFNFDVLGARGRWYIPDAHGYPGSDRITVDWPFHSPGTAKPQLPTGPTPGIGEALDAGGAVLLGLPTAKPQRPALADALRRQLSELFESGYTAASCRRADPETAVYTLTKETT